MSITCRVLCTLCALLAGCGPAGPPALDRVSAAAAVDSGNVSFAAGDHAAALEHYRAAAAANDTSAAAWFGIYMASRALGDSTSAAEALVRVERMVPDAAWREHPHDVQDPPSTLPATAEPAAPRAR